MRYGLPYKGSKNLIARKLVDFLPSAETFVDLFAGGCAMTHCAMLSGKYRKFIANDINDSVELFRRASNGELANERRWISREDFFRLKDTDPYVRILWSFGNDNHSYLFGRHIEPWKKALWMARVDGDCSMLREFGLSGDGSRKWVMENYAECERKYIEWAKPRGLFSNLVKWRIDNRCEIIERLDGIGMDQAERLQSLERVQSLSAVERLGRANSITHGIDISTLECSQLDYRAVKIPPNSLVYADPPYSNTTGYISADGCIRFDGNAFWQWCREQPFPIYISEYNAPPDFVPILLLYKFVSINTKNGGCRSVEKLFVHARWQKAVLEHPSLF